MTERFTFLNEQWFWPICFIALLVWLVFLWKERSDFGKQRFYLKSAVSLISVIAVVLIALKPMISSSKDSSQMVLLTNGYEETQVDSLIKTNKGLTVESYVAGSSIYKNDDAPSSLFVLGEGLKSFDLWQLDSIPSILIEGNTPTGITRLKYNSSYTVGDLEIIKGIYSNGSRGHKLILQGPSGIALDSVELTTEATQEFQMTLDSKISGNYLFNVLEKDSVGKTITKDPLPVTILKQDPLKILIINGAPTFETKYLKNFLANEGHEVAVRSRLTTSRYKFEYFNLKIKPVIGFTEKKLEIFDLVIIDANSLRNLSRTGRSALETSIRDNGLGLLIQPENSYFTASFQLSPFSFTSEKSNDASIEEWPKITIGKHPFRFKAETRIEPILNSNSKTLSAYKRIGSGRIGTTLLQNTYDLVLNGRSETYRYLWAKTIKSLSKRGRPTVEWSSNGIVGYKDEPFKFQLRTSLNEPIVNTNDESTIPMRSHMDISTLWEGTSFPREIGWQKFNVQQDTTATFSFYVTDTTHWRSLNTYRTIKANKRHLTNTNVIDSMPNKSFSLINPIWFFIIFTLGIGYLWLAPKL